MMRPRILCHQVGKKVLLLMIELLQGRRKKQRDEVDKAISKAPLQVGKVVS